MMKTISKIYSTALLACMLMAAIAFSSWAQDKKSDTVPVFKKPGQATEDVLKKKAEELKGQQKAVRQQRRDEQIREWQELSTGKRYLQPPPIYGQTPLQQQQMALRDQKRQLRWQQEQAERAKRNQQLQFQKQKQQKP